MGDIVPKSIPGKVAFVVVAFGILAIKTIVHPARLAWWKIMARPSWERPKIEIGG